MWVLPTARLAPQQVLLNSIIYRRYPVELNKHTKGDPNGL